MDSTSGGTRNINNELKLDPGVPTRRNRSLGCQCIIFVILTTLGLVAAIFIALNIGYVFHRMSELPHAALLYKTNSSTDLVDPATVIRPLIDEKQTFDIVATIWLRTSDSSSGSAISTLPTEKALFTGTVFRGLRLKDKDIHATVNYTVPTQIFKNRGLKTHDLRASFVLVPTSPSLLDNLTNYSTWRNEKILFPPFRPWHDTGSPLTLQDKAIDSFGVSIGLVDFLEIRSRCGPRTSNTTNALEQAPSENDKGDEDSDEEADSDNPNEDHSDVLSTDHSSSRLVLESHPYIISRSFLRVVEMTKLYDRKAYNKAHQALKTNACGLVFSPPNYDWKACTQQFRKHENIDTRLQLKMGENRNETKTHWAYGPYLTLARNPWALIKDLVPVPVNREDCTQGGRFNNSEPLLPDQDFVNITWQIVYSGRTPFKLSLSEVFPNSGVTYNMTETEEVQQDVQFASEMIQGLRGNRGRKDIHPRRIFFRKLLSIIFGVIIRMIDVHYWYTRSSTVGISKIATILFAATTLASYFLVNLSQINGDWFTMLLFTLAYLPFELSPSLLMLKVVWRIEFEWNQEKGKGKRTKKWKEMKRWLPGVHFAKPTHAERASDRLDARTPWTVKLSLFILCCLTYFFFSPTTSFFLVPPVGVSQIDEHPLRTIFLRTLTLSGLILGSGLQLWFNHQSRTFAGKYKSTAILEGIVLMLNMLKFSTRLFGNRLVRDGFSAHDLVNAGFVAVWCYQAVTLPTVRREEVDDEVE